MYLETGFRQLIERLRRGYAVDDGVGDIGITPTTFPAVLAGDVSFVAALDELPSWRAVATRDASSPARRALRKR